MHWRRTHSTWALCVAGTLAAMSLNPHPSMADVPSIVWQQDAHSQGVAALDYSADGEVIASGGGDGAGNVKIWQSADGTELGSMDADGDGIFSVDLGPGGAHIAVGSLISGYPPGGVTFLRSLEDGSLLFTVGGCFAEIAPDGSAVAAGGCGVLRHINVKSIPGGQTLGSFYHGDYVRDVAWLPNGSLVASAGGETVSLWNLHSQSLEMTFGPHADDVSCISFSPDSRLLAAGEGGWEDPGGSQIRVWDVETGDLVRTLDGHGVWVYDVAFSPDGQFLISSGRDSDYPNLLLSIRVWDVAQGILLQEYTEETEGGVRTIRFSPDGGTFGYGRGDGTLVVAVNEQIPSSVESSTSLGGMVLLVPPRPNPTSASVSIGFDLEGQEVVRLSVHDAAGRHVASLIDGVVGEGRHEVSWNGRMASGDLVAPGVYFVRLATPRGSAFQKTVVLR